MAVDAADAKKPPLFLSRGASLYKRFAGVFRLPRSNSSSDLSPSATSSKGINRVPFEVNAISSNPATLRAERLA